MLYNQYRIYTDCSLTTWKWYRQMGEYNMPTLSECDTNRLYRERICYRCLKHVENDNGIIVKQGYSDKSVFHADCAKHIDINAIICVEPLAANTFFEQ